MAYNGQHMMREYAGGSVGGILRKPQNTNNNNNINNKNGLHAYNAAAVGSFALNNINKNNHEPRQIDLLVFGYACKIFRDDDKAREIDQGKHLIPWMGDANLKIDRYDVRGALYDLAPYEAPPGGYGNRLEYLSAEEQRAEQLCEEERYIFLYNNEEEHILQQEEEMKRLKQATSDCSYNQVSFQYGDEAAPAQHGPNPQTPDEAMAAEQEFMLPRNFEVPPSLALPDTMKQHAIIEKTARFIASQGIQMEILLKAKQSNNMQFEFLTQNSTLNPYYRHMMNAIKNGTYPAESVADTAEDEVAEAKDADFKNSIDFSESAHFTTVPTIKYTPSENCAYTQLISKIKGVPVHDVISESAREKLKTPSPPLTISTTTTTAAAATTTSTTTTTAYKINNDSSPKVEILKNTSALALAQNYDSDTESEVEEEITNNTKSEPQLNFPIPTDNLKNIIDKTATYVIKNGRKFEETLRCKSEDRFMFLLTDNEYYPYYLYKVTGDPDAASKEQKTRKAAAVAAALMSRKGLISDKNLSTVTPVSFMIKAKDEGPVGTLPPAALPQDPSDDEEENSAVFGSSSMGAMSNADGNNRQVPEQVQKAIQLVESQLMARNSQMVLNAPPSVSSKNRNDNTAKQSTIKHHNNNNNNNNNNNTNSNNNIIINSNNKSEQERNAQFEQQQQNRNKEMKRAEEKVKDKLAQIAREKLCGLISKEKQLQLERKRKALAFLNQIKSNSPTEAQFAGSSTETTCNLQTSTDEPSKNYGSDSDTSVHSIPISSYGPEDEDDDADEKGTMHGVVNPFPIIESTLSKVKDSMATVTVSDDDDCQLVSETRPHGSKESRRRHGESVGKNGKIVESKRSRATSHERSSESHVVKKKKSKKHQRSTRSRSRSRERRSRSHHSRHSPSTRSSRHQSNSRNNNSCSDDDDSDEHTRRRKHKRRHKH